MWMNYSKLNWQTIGNHIGVVLGLTVATITFDMLPRYQQGQFTINQEVLAQTPSDADLQNYANAVKAIENLRQQTYSSIQQMVGQSPSLACNQKQNFSQLPDDARNVAVDYCTQSENIVRQNGLTINQFNRITQQLKDDRDLYKRVQMMIKN